MEIQQWLSASGTVHCREFRSTFTAWRELAVDLWALLGARGVPCDLPQTWSQVAPPRPVTGEGVGPLDACSKRTSIRRTSASLWRAVLSINPVSAARRPGGHHDRTRIEGTAVHQPIVIPLSDGRDDKGSRRFGLPVGREERWDGHSHGGRGSGGGSDRTAPGESGKRSERAGINIVVASGPSLRDKSKSPKFRVVNRHEGVSGLVVADGGSTCELIASQSRLASVWRNQGSNCHPDKRRSSEPGSCPLRPRDRCNHTH